MGCHFLLRNTFPTRGSNTRLLHWQADSSPLSHLGSFILSPTFPLIFLLGTHVTFVCSTVSKLPIACGVETRLWAVVSLAWLHLTIFLTSLRFICFISKNTCYKAQVTRLLWRLHSMMLLAQSRREWSSLNICSLFVITLPDSELVWWWWPRLVPFRQNLQLPENGSYNMERAREMRGLMS